MNSLRENSCKRPESRLLQPYLMRNRQHMAHRWCSHSKQTNEAKSSRRDTWASLPSTRLFSLPSLSHSKQPQQSLPSQAPLVLGLCKYRGPLSSTVEMPRFRSFQNDNTLEHGHMLRCGPHGFCSFDTWVGWACGHVWQHATLQLQCVSRLE